MKKVLLFAMALVATMSVNAQVEIVAIDDDAVARLFPGEPTVAQKDKTDLTNWPLAAGTTILSTESVVCTNLFSDEYGYAKTGLSKNNVTVNGNDFGSVSGIQGSVNGPGTAASEGAFPTTGCLWHFVPNKDGFLYVIHKASANKNYVVFEEKFRIPYIFASENGGYDLNTIEGATETVDGITNIAEGYAIGQAQAIIGEDGKGAGTCVIKFPVYEGLGYDVLATGSKMTLAGFVFDTTGDATIALTLDEGENVILQNGQLPGGDPTGINSVKAAAENDGAIYNIAGQRVANDYKGLVIKNGKKVVIK